MVLRERAVLVSRSFSGVPAPVCFAFFSKGGCFPAVSSFFLFFRRMRAWISSSTLYYNMESSAGARIKRFRPGRPSDSVALDLVCITRSRDPEEKGLASPSRSLPTEVGQPGQLLLPLRPESLSTRMSQKAPAIKPRKESRIFRLSSICFSLFCFSCLFSLLVKGSFFPPGSPPTLTVVSATNAPAGSASPPGPSSSQISTKRPSLETRTEESQPERTEREMTEGSPIQGGAMRIDNSTEGRETFVKDGLDEFTEHLYLQGQKKEGWYSATFEFQFRTQLGGEFRIEDVSETACV